MRSRLAIAAACFCSMTALAQDQATVSQPDVGVGDSWAYLVIDPYTKETRGEWLFDVVEVSGSSIKTELNRDGSSSTRIYGRDWSLSKDFLLFSFPLEAGKKWKSKTSYETSDCGPTSDDLTAEVKGWEDIKVPAGKFRALRIEHNGFWTSRCGSGRKLWWYWYVPSVKHFVRFESRAWNPRGQIGFEQVLVLKSMRLQ